MTTGVKAVPIRKAIRDVLKAAYIAKETNNRELYLNCRDWLKRNLRHRNTGMQWLFK